MNFEVYVIESHVIRGSSVDKDSLTLCKLNDDILSQCWWRAGYCLQTA